MNWHPLQPAAVIAARATVAEIEQAIGDAVRQRAGFEARREACPYATIKKTSSDAIERLDNKLRRLEAAREMKSKSQS